MASLTTQLTDWICQVKLDDVPADVIERAKSIMLDGIACGLVGSHLPWSEIGTKAILEFESPGPCNIWGWEQKVGPLAAALVNSSFVQGFELDDFHKASPNHSASLILPSLLAATEYEKFKSGRQVSGREFLLAFIIGLEVSPRVGLGLGGKKLLSRGIHSGTLMGHFGAAAACSRILQLNHSQTEQALGIAGTQACGLMSAQGGSMVKRMQHGFAARNGLFACLMTRSGYTGIDQIFDVSYGGFFPVWTGGEVAAPEEVVRGLGTNWETMRYVIKLHASMGAVHTPIECMEKLMKREPRVTKIDEVKNIHIELGHACYHHGCFDLPPAPLPPTAAQMSVAFGVAAQLVDGQVFVQQFAHDKIDRQDLRDIVVNKTTCAHDPSFDTDDKGFSARITVTFMDGAVTSEELRFAKSILPGITDDEMHEKAVGLLGLVTDGDRLAAMQKAVSGVEKLQDVTSVAQILAARVPCPI